MEQIRTDPKTLTETQLKAACYDWIAQKELAEENIRLINQELISRRSIIKENKMEEEVKEVEETLEETPVQTDPNPEEQG